MNRIHKWLSFGLAFVCASQVSACASNSESKESERAAETPNRTDRLATLQAQDNVRLAALEEIMALEPPDSQASDVKARLSARVASCAPEARLVALDCRGTLCRMELSYGVSNEFKSISALIGGRERCVMGNEREFVGYDYVRVPRTGPTQGPPTAKLFLHRRPSKHSTLAH